MKEKGLTLIEVLVMVAVLGILSSIITSAILGKDEKPKKSDQATSQSDKFNRSTNTFATSAEVGVEPTCGAECEKQKYNAKMIQECINRYSN